MFTIRRGSIVRMIPTFVAATAVLFATVVAAQDVSIEIGEVEDQCANQCTMAVTWLQHALDLNGFEAQYMWEGCLGEC